MGQPESLGRAVTAIAETPTLTTGRLVLRTPGPNDIDRIVALIRDEAVVQWLARVPWSYRRSDAETWVARAVDGAATGEEFAFAVDKGGLIGVVGLRDVKTSPELGYWLGRAWWGQGVMTEAVGAVLSFAFDTLSLSGISSGAFKGNDASLAIQKKFGFIETGECEIPSLYHGRTLRHIDTRLSESAYRSHQL